MWRGSFEPRFGGGRVVGLDGIASGLCALTNDDSFLRRGLSCAEAAGASEGPSGGSASSSPLTAVVDVALSALSLH